ncbi:MAG: hypothetical protein Q8L97_08780 [Nitrosomonas sp.]|uniref:hypothetical protein n=1 Tax=Nitrosomonas sp. TaxID=42353 RepID=UPI0027322867|nr:hypothetical protein [Nitrosomonas sp.]MDP1550238.1 hypothetical protein [Nitrosomonas sp.]
MPKDTSMDLDQFATKIRKTGFVLENRVAIELKRAGWTVISNKYYEDDFEGSVREIDLLAYKVSKIQHIDVYTTLLISCKKNESNVWALLARDINLKDPNSDWWPLHAWSNDKPLMYELTQIGRSKIYHDEVKTLFGVSEALSIPDVEVFAFQEMKRSDGSPQNDKNIFSAVTSLMKAQAYELSSLSQRKKAAAVYQFNLLSVIDSDLIRLKFTGDEIKAEPINSEHYIARYIIKKKESFSRVRFLTAASFNTSLEDYNRLHAANCQWFERTYNNFFDEAIKDWKRTEVFIEEFREKLRWSLFWRLKRDFNKSYNTNILSLDWKSKENRLAVTLSVDSEVLEFLNGDDETRKAVEKALKEIYRYTGDFYFAEDDLPF